jgi:hypothetical protein
VWPAEMEILPTISMVISDAAFRIELLSLAITRISLWENHYFIIKQFDISRRVDREAETAPASSHDLPNPDFWEDGGGRHVAKLLIVLARPKRFELLTPRFVVRTPCSRPRCLSTDEALRTSYSDFCGCPWRRTGNRLPSRWPRGRSPGRGTWRFQLLRFRFLQQRRPALLAPKLILQAANLSERDRSLHGHHLPNGAPPRAELRRGA